MLDFGISAITNFLRIYLIYRFVNIFFEKRKKKGADFSGVRLHFMLPIRHCSGYFILYGSILYAIW